jgi:hypothetical protein
VRPVQAIVVDFANIEDRLIAVWQTRCHGRRLVSGTVTRKRISVPGCRLPLPFSEAPRIGRTRMSFRPRDAGPQSGGPRAGNQYPRSLCRRVAQWPRPVPTNKYRNHRRGGDRTVAPPPVRWVLDPGSRAAG